MRKVPPSFEHLIQEIINSAFWIYDLMNNWKEKPGFYFLFILSEMTCLNFTKLSLKTDFSVPRKGCWPFYCQNLWKVLGVLQEYNSLVVKPFYDRFQMFLKYYATFIFEKQNIFEWY